MQVLNKLIRDKKVNVAVHGHSCPAISCILSTAAAAAPLRSLGANSSAAGLSIVCVYKSQVDSIGYRCWTGRSVVPLDVLCVAPVTIQSLPLISLVTVPCFHRFLFFFSSFTIRTSPTLRWHVCSPAARRCCSRRLHSRDHLFNIDVFTPGKIFGSLP